MVLAMGTLGGRRGLFGNVDDECDGSEAVVVGALGMVEEQLPRLDQYNTVCDEG